MDKPVDQRRQRDSHDLSVQLTRYSVVDSMLLSLSGFPGDAPALPPSNLDSSFPPSTYNINDDPYVDSHPLPATRRNRGHTYSSSMSDYDSVNINDTASRYTAYHAHARVNAPGPVSQKPARAERPRDPDSYPPPSLQTPTDEQSSMPIRSRASKSHRQKDSEGSSIEMGSDPRWARAASFDQSTRDGGLRHTPKRAPRPPPLDTARDPMLDYATFDDAAPTPTVPGGPRRRQETIGAPSAPVTPRKSAPSRQNSVKSSRTVKKGKTSSGAQDSSIRDQARQFVSATNNIRNGQSVPTIPALSAAPSPTVGGIRKGFPSPTVAQPPPKERPGFFRKFFGSSKSNQNSNSHHDDYANQSNRNSSGAPDRPKTQPTQAPAGHFQSASRPPTQDTSISRGEVSQTLRKSTSSFFRRRKKSFSENVETIPPVPPIQIHQYQGQNTNFSRLSLMNGVQAEENSLRNIMAPYLNDGVTPANVPEAYYDSREHQHKQETAGDTRYSELEKSNNRDVVSSGHGALDSSRPSAGTNPERSRTLDGGNLRQVSSVRGIMRGVHGSDEVNYNSGISYRNAAAKSPPFLSDGAFQALERIDSPAGVSEPSEPSRPAPDVPGSDLSFTGRRGGPGGSLTPKLTDKTALSPISDRSFLSSNTSTPLAFDGTGDDFRLHQDIVSNDTHSRQSKSPRVWLRPSDSDEELRKHKGDLSPPADTARIEERHSPKSPEGFFSSATSLPIVQVDDKEVDMDLTSDSAPIVSPDKSISDEDRIRARQIFEGDESLVSKALAASWLGQTAAINTSTRTAYMELYDWGGLNILAAFRELCTRLVVRAESQQLDRVIDAFSERWCECNSNHGFKDRDVVHTIAFSILMLNTDLHLAEIEQRMTKSQFVRNTLPTIRSIAEAAADNVDSHRMKSQKGSGPSVPNTPLLPPPSGLDRPSLDVTRASRIANNRSDSEGFSAEPSSMDSCNLLVSSSYDGAMKGWESQVEVILKDFYGSIRSDRLPLHGANSNDDSKRQQSNGSLSVMASALRRSPSVLSKAPSESVSFRGRPGEMRSATARFTSKSRTRPRLYPSSTVGSSRTSLDDQSMWSPAASTWTKYSLGKTQTSFSVESLGSWGRGTGYTQAIGFANAINQAMIREEAGNKEGLLSSGDSVDFGRTVPLLEDETLELHGPPWAKEGLVRHKLQDKKTKDRGWSECFAVIEKGQMRLFSFPSNQGHSSVKGAFRHFRPNKPKQSHGSASSGGDKVVGGGNWIENAHDIASFTLRQTYATTLAREHSKTQAFVWALTLPTGAVHAFAVGSGELREEWISTANYWSARLSKEPLIGGVSNIEYGWSETIILGFNSDTASPTVSSPPQTAASASAAPGTGHSASNSRTVSRANSIVHEGHGRRRSSNPNAPPVSGSRPPSSLSRGSLDHGHRAHVRLPGDKVNIADWRPPVSSMMASQLMEVDQRNALQAYVTALDDELKKHNELRTLMSKSFSPRHPNAAKAINNWNHKCHYLHTEIFKYKTYIEALNNASKSKEKIYAEQEEREKQRKGEEKDNDGEQVETKLPNSDVDPSADLEKADGMMMGVSIADGNEK